MSSITQTMSLEAYLKPVLSLYPSGIFFCSLVCRLMKRILDSGGMRCFSLVSSLNSSRI